MSVYRYIAQTNPDQANMLCMNYGFPESNTPDEIEAYLVEIVSQDGENGLIQIMQIHPDKDLILDLNQNQKNFSQKKNFTDSSLMDLPVKNYYSDPNIEGKPIILKNAIGDTNTNVKTSLAKNTNNIILASALIVSLAIILSIKK